jgi:peptidoglycan/xylan/chitin deacetylase (PgdA/CDA1 family)
MQHTLARAFVGILRLAGRLLYWSGAAPLVIRARRAPRVVAYHACEPQENDFIRGLNSNVTPSHLARHLDFYARHYDVVPMASLEGGGPRPSRALAITFDDGYRSVFTHAVPLLRERGLPAITYLVGNVLSRGVMIWVNELNWHAHRAPDSTSRAVQRTLKLDAMPSPSDVVALAIQHYDPDAIPALLEELRTTPHGQAWDAAGLFATWNDVLAARESMTYGNHTASHPNLTRLSPEAQISEIESAQRTLSERLGPVTSFAYPFGVRDDSARRSARARFRSVVLAGSSDRAFDPHDLGRVVVEDTSVATLFADLEVVHPMKTWLRGLRGPGGA